MKTIRVNKFIREAGICIATVDKILGKNINANDKIVIGLEEDMPKQPFDLVDKSNEELILLAKNIEQVLEHRANQVKIIKLKAEIHNAFAELAELGITKMYQVEDELIFE